MRWRPVSCTSFRTNWAWHHNGMSAEKRVAVVTGASRGAGKGIAAALVADGWTVYLTGRTVTDPGDGGIAVPVDHRDDDAVAALFARVADESGRLDLLVNNAGGAIGQKPVREAEIDAWQTMYEVNVLGTARVTRALLPALINGQGTIVFVTSTAAEAAYEGGAGYCGVKSAERALAGSLRLELFDQPVRVCEISPGMVHTEEFSLTRFGGDQAKADAAGLKVMGQDISAACWQAGMGQNPGADPQQALDACTQKWQVTDKVQTCELFYTSIRNLTPPQAQAKCTSSKS